MTQTGHGIDAHRPLHTDHQLLLTLEDLLQGANLPQLWFVFLDRDTCLTEPFMPFAGYPDDPSEIVETTDLGRVPIATVLCARLRAIAEMVGAASVVLVWERPGPDELAPETRAWVRQMAHACRDADITIRAQLLLHDDGLRMLVTDDCA